MTGEELLFLKVLSDNLHQRTTEPLENINWGVVFSISEKHKLTSIVYNQCRSFIPQDYQAKMKIRTLLQYGDFNSRKLLACSIQKEFTEENIPFAIIKGLEVAKLYPSPESRAMGDIDIVVHAEDKKRAAEVLHKMGFSGNSTGMYEWIFEKNGIEVELHHQMQYENVTENKKSFAYTEKVWENVNKIPGSSEFELDWNFHLVFLLIHLKKHFVEGGAGVRLFFDLAAVMLNASIDEKRLIADLKDIDLLDFAEICFSFCNMWFQTDFSISCNLDESFYENATHIAIENGTFGNANYGLENYMTARISESGRLKAFLKRYFPPLKHMKVDPRFCYLNKLPILLPYAWLSRFAFSIKQKGRLMIELKRLKLFFSTNKKINERKNNLDNWKIK